MALSGSFNTTAYSGRYLTFSWSATQNVANNTSTISWQLVGAGTGSGYYMAGNFKVVIAGETVYSSATRIELRVGTVVASGTKTLTHNADGTKAFSASAQAGIYTVAVNCTGSGNFTLNTIPRASTASNTNSVIGNWSTCTINAASTMFTHTVKATFGTITTTVAEKTAYPSISWSIPTSWYSQIPNAKSGTATLTCQTYNGNTLIGTTTSTFSVSINEEDSKPSISGFVYDTNDDTINLTGDDAKLIRYHSNAYCQASPVAVNYATINSTVIQCGGDSFIGTPHTFNNVESGTFKFITTDSRGLTATFTETCTLVNYIHLTCVMKDNKPDTQGNFTFEVDGNCFNGNFGAATNMLTVQYRYKEGNGSYSSWQTMSVSRSGNTYSATVDITGLDYTQTYTFQAKAADQLESVTTDAVAVKSLPVFDWSGEDFNFNVPVNFSAGATGIGGGGGIAYGTCTTSGSVTAKVVNSDDFGELKKGACINVKFSYANTATSPTMNVNGTGAKSIKKYGTTGSMAYMWYTGEVVQFVYDGTYWVMVDGGTATTTYYGATKLQSTITNTDTVAATPGAVYDYINTTMKIESGTWTPTVIRAASYTTQEGWYQRIGNIVTVGFLCSGTWNSQASTTFEMYGLPYTNGDTMAAGGGIVFNARVSANTIFCGWVILPNTKTIGARSYPVPTGTGGLPLGAGINTNPSSNFTVGGTITYSVA